MIIGLALGLLSLPQTGYVPPLSEAVVYEANLRAEGPTGGFVSLTKRLDSIKALGVNVLWLMPIQPVGKLRSAGGLGSPYAVADFDSVNPEFGSEGDLRALVAAAHQRKMAIIIDWVANHTAWDHPWIKSHPDWYTRDAGGKIVIPAGTNWQDVADLDYSKSALREAMMVSMEGWVKRFGIDGFRCDTADWLPADFWKSAIPRLRSISSKPLLMLAEGFRADHYSSGFDLTYGWQFFDRLCAIYKGAKASELAQAVANEAREIPTGARRLRFITNHDKAAWDGTTLEFFKTPQGVRTAFAVTALYGGTPLIYSGQEVAWPERIPIFERSTIDWSRDRETAKWIASLFHLRTEPALLDGRVEDVSTDDAIVFHKSKGGSEALVVANVRDRSLTVEIPKASQKAWRDGLTNSHVDLPASVKLAPYECRIYIRPLP